MDISTVYIALVFLVPIALGLTLLRAMASDWDVPGLLAAKPKAPATAKRKVVIDHARDDAGCYA